MESNVHVNQNPYRSATTTVLLMDYNPSPARLETKPDKQRMSHKHICFVVEWQMYNQVPGNT